MFFFGEKLIIDESQKVKNNQANCLEMTEEKMHQQERWVVNSYFIYLMFTTLM